jgi:hypothetical protein
MEGKKRNLLEIHICTNAAIWKIKREIIYQWHRFTLVYDLESNRAIVYRWIPCSFQYSKSEVTVKERLETCNTKHLTETCYNAAGPADWKLAIPNTSLKLVTMLQVRLELALSISIVWLSMALCQQPQRRSRTIRSAATNTMSIHQRPGSSEL